LTVNAAPAVSATGSSPVCEGSNITLSATGTGTFSWTGPNGFSSAQQNPTLIGASANNSGTYVVTITGSNNCTATASVAISVATAGGGTAAANSPICAGGTLNLSASGGSIYSWTGPNGYSSSLQNPTVANAVAGNSGVYTVTIAGSGSCSGTATVRVVVNPKPTATITGPTQVCRGGSIVLSATGGVSYLWTPGNVSSQSLTVTNEGLYAVTVTDANGCTDTKSVNVTETPSQLTVQNRTVCDGGTISLNVSAAESYLWIGPANFTSTQQNPTIQNTAYR
jgi:hypothetical protein